MDGLIYVDEDIWTGAVKSMEALVKKKIALSKAKAVTKKKGLKK